MGKELRVGDTFICLKNRKPVVRCVGMLPQRMFLVMTENLRVISVYSSLEAIKEQYDIVEIIRFNK